MLVFEHPSRAAPALTPAPRAGVDQIPNRFLRQRPPALPCVPATALMRHYAGLAGQNQSADRTLCFGIPATAHGAPPLEQRLAQLAGLLAGNPHGPASHAQGLLSCLHELQEALRVVSGMEAVSVAAAGCPYPDLPALMMVRACHRQHPRRTHVLLAEDAHDTGACVSRIGFEPRPLPQLPDGGVDPTALSEVLDDRVACVVFDILSRRKGYDSNLRQAIRACRSAGALSYCTGTGLELTAGRLSPAALGFDLARVPLTTVRCDGSGLGGHWGDPVAAGPELSAYLPLPIVIADADEFRWATPTERPLSIGTVSSRGGAGLVPAWACARQAGAAEILDGATWVAQSARYLAERLARAGFEVEPMPRGPANAVSVRLGEPTRAGVNPASGLCRRLLTLGIRLPPPAPEATVLRIELDHTHDRPALDALVRALATAQTTTDRLDR